MRLGLLTTPGEEHRGTRLHQYQIISASALATVVTVKIMNSLSCQPILATKHCACRCSDSARCSKYQNNPYVVIVKSKS